MFDKNDIEAYRREIPSQNLKARVMDAYDLQTADASGSTRKKTPWYRSAGWGIAAAACMAVGIFSLYTQVQGADEPMLQLSGEPEQPVQMVAVATYAREQSTPTPVRLTVVTEKPATVSVTEGYLQLLADWNKKQQTKDTTIKLSDTTEICWMVMPGTTEARMTIRSWWQSKCYLLWYDEASGQWQMEIEE